MKGVQSGIGYSQVYYDPSVAVKVYSDCAMPWLLAWGQAVDDKAMAELSELRPLNLKFDQLIEESFTIVARCLLRMEPSRC